MFLRYFFTFILTASFIVSVNAQIPFHSLDQKLQATGLPPVDDNKEESPLPPQHTWKENVSERTLYSSSYTTPDGRVIYRYSKRPINYMNGGQLVPIDPSLKYSGNRWSAPFQPYPTYLNDDGSTELTMENGSTIKLNFQCKMGTISSRENVFLIENNKVFYPEFFPGIDKETEFRENGVKSNYVLKQAPVFSGNFLEISEELVIPKGYVFTRSDLNGREENGGWSGDLSLVGPKNEEAAHFVAPLCFDAAGNYIIGTYVLDVNSSNGNKILKIRVPATWLNDPQRVYPIVVDPLVVGPTAMWTGGTMPSCIVPAYNADSIQVTVPAGISVTGLFVTSSYYADPFTTATMAMGALRFRTSCATSVTFTVQPPQGNTPGTAYLDSFDLKNPLMCCMQNSCSTRTFYLTMLLGRTAPMTGCNTTYIRYDPISTLWPFSALVVGRTPEAYANQWMAPTSPVCGNTCTIQCTAYIRYGVPPYTLTHPWMLNPVTIGTLNSGCATGAQQPVLTLTVPGCPRICDTTSSLSIPPPTVIDACGSVVTGIPTRVLLLKPAPDITATPSSQTICSGETYSVTLTSCLSTATTNWFGNSQNGTGNFGDTLYNTGTSANNITFSAFATLNGCFSDTATATVIVDPLPVGAIAFTPVPVIANIPTNFTDESLIYAGTASGWFWDFGDNSTSTQQDPVHTFLNPGNYNVCLIVTTSSGCVDSICQMVEVIAPDVIEPNVVTPNGDNTNDFLSFKYLEFFADNRIEVYNRWGNLLFSQDNYLNDWSPDKVTPGTYYYVLDVKDLKKVYRGYFEVLK